MRVFVDARGKVTEAEPVECPEVFVPEALRAATRITFYPLKVDGEKTPFTFVLLYEFRLGPPPLGREETAPRAPSFDWARDQGRCGECVVKLKIGPEGGVQGSELGACDLGMAGPALEALEGVQFRDTGRPEAYRIHFEHTEDCSPEGDHPQLVWAYADPTHRPSSVDQSLGVPTAWVAPAYPQRQKQEVVCTARILVHPEGHVDHVKVWGCAAPFAEVTRETLERWVYTPFERNGAPMWRSVQWDLHFDPAQPFAEVTKVGEQP